MSDRPLAAVAMQHYYPVPTSYCWSPALLPQPADWPANAEVVGFCQLGVSERTQYQPPAELVAFLKEGSPPVYVGFGSMSLKHPKVGGCAVPPMPCTGL